MQLVPHPTRLDIRNLANTWHMLCCVTKFGYDTWFNSIKHASKDGARRLPNNSEDGDGNKQTDDRIGESEAQPHPGSPEHDCKAGQSVSASVVAIRN